MRLARITDYGLCVHIAGARELHRIDRRAAYATVPAAPDTIQLDIQIGHDARQAAIPLARKIFKIYKKYIFISSG